MGQTIRLLVMLGILFVAGPQIVAAEAESDSGLFNLLDVFQLEWASDPQISPDGEQVVYVRNFMDIMQDRRRSNLWIVNADGSEHRPLTSGTGNDTSPRWSADGKRLLYVAADDSAQLYIRWMADQMWTFVPAQAIVGRCLGTFKDFPPTQSSSLSVEKVLKRLERPNQRQ